MGQYGQTMKFLPNFLILSISLLTRVGIRKSDWIGLVYKLYVFVVGFGLLQ